MVEEAANGPQRAQPIVIYGLQIRAIDTGRNGYVSRLYPKEGRSGWRVTICEDCAKLGQVGFTAWRAIFRRWVIKQPDKLGQRVVSIASCLNGFLLVTTTSTDNLSTKCCGRSASG